MKKSDDFAVFILTHGRPDNVITWNTLKKQGYSGEIYLIIDNEDKTADHYRSRYGAHVITFDKSEAAKKVDTLDNFKDRNAVVYARNACFDIAEELGIKYFLMFDDDYTAFDFRVYTDEAKVKPVKNLDLLFHNVLEYFKSIDACSIALAQGGDFIGGLDNGKSLFRFSKRKAMNTFFCSTKRRFPFIGKINEDVNTYIAIQSIGSLFLTIANASITQKTTQKNKGGLTDIYLDYGTYVKSFYTIICAPSSVKVRMLNSSSRRLHHSIDWDRAVPCIIDQKYKKQ